MIQPVINSSQASRCSLLLLKLECGHRLSSIFPSFVAGRIVHQVKHEAGNILHMDLPVQDLQSSASAGFNVHSHALTAQRGAGIGEDSASLHEQCLGMTQRFVKGKKKKRKQKKSNGSDYRCSQSGEEAIRLHIAQLRPGKQTWPTAKLGCAEPAPSGLYEVDGEFKRCCPKENPEKKERKKEKSSYPSTRWSLRCPSLLPRKRSPPSKGAKGETRRCGLSFDEAGEWAHEFIRPRRLPAHSHGRCGRTWTACLGFYVDHPSRFCSSSPSVQNSTPGRCMA